MNSNSILVGKNFKAQMDQGLSFENKHHDMLIRRKRSLKSPVGLVSHLRKRSVKKCEDQHNSRSLTEGSDCQIKRRWTKSEISLLWQLWKNGKPLKIIAFELGRTVTSINKALKRFNLRPAKERKNTCKDISKKKESKGKKAATQRSLKSRRQNLDLWVPFEVVLLWLKEQGKHIKKWCPYQVSATGFRDLLPEIKGDASYISEDLLWLYVCEGKVMTPFEVLVWVNRERFAKDLAPYYVAHLTYC